MTARESYPELAKWLAIEGEWEIDSELSAALDEIDRLRALRDDHEPEPAELRTRSEWHGEEST